MASGEVITECYVARGSPLSTALTTLSRSRFWVLMNEKIMTAKIRFMRKNWPTTMIKTQYSAPKIEMSTSIKFWSWTCQLSELMIWKTESKEVKTLSKFVTPYMM